MPDILETVNESIFIWEGLFVTCETFITSYGSLIEANSYFDNRLNSQMWQTAPDTTKRQALLEATRAIDRLNFIGSKAVETQDLQFPRSLDTIIPSGIKIATFELALKLLDGLDIDLEIQTLFMTSQGVSTLRTTYDRSSIPDYVRAGIPSSIAWGYLRPYLRNPETIIMSRAN